MRFSHHIFQSISLVDRRQRRFRWNQFVASAWRRFHRMCIYIDDPLMSLLLWTLDIYIIDSQKLKILSLFALYRYMMTSESKEHKSNFIISLYFVERSLLAEKAWNEMFIKLFGSFPHTMHPSVPMISSHVISFHLNDEFLLLLFRLHSKSIELFLNQFYVFFPHSFFENCQPWRWNFTCFFFVSTLLFIIHQFMPSGFFNKKVATSTGVVSHQASLQVVVPEAFILGSGELHVDMGSVLNLVCIIEKVIIINCESLTERNLTLLQLCQWFNSLIASHNIFSIFFHRVQFHRNTYIGRGIIIW